MAASNEQRKAWKEALRHKKEARGLPVAQRNQAGMGPNKAAGRKGGIRRQGSKRG